jgi:hypothetical protein
MKNVTIFILIFFLFFSIYLKSAKASATDCHVYIDGICQSGLNYDTTGYPSGETGNQTTIGETSNQTTSEETGGQTTSSESTEITTEPTGPIQVINRISESAGAFSITLISLAFQLFGIIVLFILLIVMIEEVIKSR